MKTISLKEAARVCQRIKEKFNYSFKHSGLNIYDESDTFAWWISTVNKRSEETRQKVTAIVTISEIRQQIQSANFTSGINALISERKMLLDVCDFLRPIDELYTSEPPMSVETLDNKRKTLVESKNTYVDHINVVTLDDAIIGHIRRTITSNRRRLNVIEDELAALNVKTTINLSADIEEFLQKHGLE